MSGLLIECKIKRQGGTMVPFGQGLDQVTYMFSPDPSGRHTALVNDAAHVAIFLAIPEAYAVVMGELVAGPAFAAMGSVKQPPAAPVEPAAVLVAPVEPAVDQDAENGPDNPGFDEAAFIPTTSLDATALANWAALSPENAAVMRAMHTAELGNPPRANALMETIAAKLVAFRSK